jgi:tetratricopeptide (TPR) repeat protein
MLSVYYKNVGGTMINRMNRLTVLALVFFTLVSMSACSTPEEKKMKYYEKGKQLYEQGDYTSARLELKNAIQIDHKFAEAFYMLGMVELKNENIQASFIDFSKASELKPDHIPSQLQLGRMYLAANLPDKALEKAAIVLKLDSHNEEAFFLKSAIYLAQKNLREAEVILNGLKLKGSRTAELYLLLASASLQRKDIPGAEEVLKEGIKANPSSASMHLLLMNLYLAIGRLPDALAQSRQIVRIEPGIMSHKLMLADILWDLGQKQESLAEISAMIKSDTKAEDNRISASRFYQKHGMRADAENTLKDGASAKKDSFKLRFALSDLYVALSEHDKAIKTLQECMAITDDPSNPKIIETRNRLGRIYLTIGDTIKANELSKAVLKESPKNTDALMLKGSIDLMKGDGLNAVSEFRTVVFENPHLVEAHISLAEAHMLNREQNLATETLKNALITNPDSRELKRALVRVYIIRKNYTDAETTLKGIIEADPKDYETWASLGDLYMGLKRYSEASERYQQIISYFPGMSLGYMRLSRLQAAQGNLDKAAKTLEQGYGKIPQDTDLISALAGLYLMRHRYDDALTICARRIGKGQGDAFTYNLQGKIFETARHFPEAEGSYLKAISLDSRWVVPHVSLAQLYLHEGKTQQAIDKFKDMAIHDPGTPGPYLALGQIYELDHKLKDAVAIYTEGLRKNPNSWDIANNLAFLLGEQGGATRLDKALEIALKARQLSPGTPSVLDTLGWIYYRKNDLSSARSILEEASAKQSDEPSINYHLGMVLYRLGLVQDAQKRLNDALKSNRAFVGHDEAIKTLEEIKQASSGRKPVTGKG